MDEVTLADLALIFARQMSAGDRSCVQAMLQRPGAQQATTAGSAHCRFYEQLSAADLAKLDTDSPLTKAAPFIRVWELTESGRAVLPGLIPALGNG